MTKIQLSHLCGRTYQAVQLWLLVLLPALASSMADTQICLRTQDTCTCSSPPPSPPPCVNFCKALIDCPADITVNVCNIGMIGVSYTYSVTHYPCGMTVNYNVPDDPGGTVTTDSIGQDFPYGNSSCSHLPGFQYPNGTTEVTCQAYDCCHRLSECSFNINLESSRCPPTDDEICNTAQIFLLVLLALNLIGWICCMVAALVPTAPPSTRSKRNKESTANEVEEYDAMSTNCPEGHDEYVNSLFQDIGETGSSKDETLETGSKTTSHD